MTEETWVGAESPPVAAQVASGPPVVHVIRPAAGWVGIDWRELWRTGRHNHARAVRQANALALRVAEQGSGLNCAADPIEAFVQLHDRKRSPASRVAGALRLGLRSQTLPRTLALYLRLLKWRA